MKTKMYLHSDKQSNLERGERLGLKGKALDNFAYALYEVEFEVEVNEETGEATILTCDGKTRQQLRENKQ